ncbi:putative ATP-dependent RNA helicase ddx17 [Dermatophagoides pteronyssinus]|uniref:RNA helicase n=1 Tax=Dermatophagoides pteronyssinus TaxID=6956 RepID=A0ABQ8JLV5_DERPT|nr:putative ATP-dependent RNA helicase ddx17 [Dermatophagoides pteronyssinus]
MTEKKYFNNTSKSTYTNGTTRGSNDRYNNYNSEHRSRDVGGNSGGIGFNNHQNNYSNGFNRGRDSFANRSNGANGFGGGGGGYRSFGAKVPIQAPPADLPVHKNFYRESPATGQRSQFEINQWLSTNSVTFRGPRVSNPILQFTDLIGLPDGIMHVIMKQGFTIPTVIQSQAWPLALNGRDVVGIAQTGSGKTLAYALPALVHVDGNVHRRKYGPSVLVLAPTRELAQQIKEVFNLFRTRAVCVFGGASKGGQRREIERTQPSIIIACPGRLIDFVEEGAIKLHNISYLVLDEADRMLDMGFEPQIRKIVDQIPKNRQTLMWSATWPKEVRKLAEDFLVDYVQVNIGSISLAANHNITQLIDVCEESEKMDKLYKLLTQVNANSRENKTIIFAETKRKVDQLNQQMKSVGWYCSAIHGDKPQTERDWALNEFKNGRTTILIATDVAARGLDVDDIKYVVNFDYPTCSEDYVHRIGRTGRRDRKGTAYTFFTLNNAKQASDLIDVLKEAKQEVPAKLYEFASQSHRFGKNIRKRYGGGGGFYGSSSNGYSNGGNVSNGFGGGMKRKYDDNNRFGSSGGKRPNFGNGTHSSSTTSNTDRFNSYA